MFLSLITPVVSATAGVNSQLSFEGKLVNASGVNIANGTYNMEFKIYQDGTNTGSGSTLKWTEDYLVAGSTGMPSTGGVTLTDGTFQVNLGSICAFSGGTCGAKTNAGVDWNQQTLWLSMQIGNTSSCTVTSGVTSFNTGCAGDGEMSPFIRLTSVPQAQVAQSANTLGGSLTATNFVQLAQGVQSDSSITNPSIFINKTNASGTPNIMQLQKSGVDVFTVSNTSQVSVRGINSEATYTSELVTSQAFNNPTYWSCSGWTTTATTAQHNSGNLSTCSATGTNLTVSSGQKYIVKFHTNSATLANTESVTVTMGGSGSNAYSAGGTDYSFIATTSNTNSLVFTPTNGFVGTITLVSVTRLTQLSSSAINVNNSNGSLGFEIRPGGAALNNTFIGVDSGSYNSTGSSNTALGHNTLTSNVSGGSNVAIGESALSSNTNGFANIAIGQALENNTSGNYNTAIGHVALQSNSFGFGNVALGYSSLNSNYSGNGNTALGTSAMDVNSTGTNNVAVGNNAVDALISGDNNTGVGYAALSNVTTGSNNTSIGYQAGYADPAVASFVSLSNLQKATMVGYGAQAQADNVLILGGADTLAVKVGIGTTAPTNLFSVSPVNYSTGTAYQDNGSAGVAGTTIHGIGTTWTSSMVGMEFIFSSGEKETISSFTNGTTLTGSVSQAVGLVGSAKAYRIHNPAFYVSSTGATGIRTSTNTTTAFQVQNAAGSNVLAVDSTNNHLKIYGANGTNYADIYYDSSTSTAYYGANTGTAVLGSGTGAVTVTAGSGAAVTITGNTNSSFTTTAGSISLTPAGALTLQGGTTASLTSTTSSSVTVDSGTTGNVIIGATNNTNAKTISVGNNNASSFVDIDGGTNAAGIEIGNTTTAHGIQIGSDATGDNDIKLGGANAGSTLTLEAGTASSSLAIGNGTTAHNIKIGAGGAAAGNTEVVGIGSGSTTTPGSTVTLQGSNLTTTNGNAGVIVGGGFSTSDTNLVPFTLDSTTTLTETASTCSATVNDGALYFNANVGSMAVRACMNGSWEDLVSTAGAFFSFFGVVPDSGGGTDVPGDIQSLSTASTTGPCKVYWVSNAATSVVGVRGCTAYSGGRKVTVAANATLNITAANNNFFHICLTGTNNQPAVSAGSTTESANLGTVSFASATGPIVCLADVKTSAAAITGIYDTRVFTTTTKEFAYSGAALALGVMVKPDGTNANRVNLPGTTATGFMRGVVVASNGAGWASGGPNVILATAGDVFVKATAGAPSTANTVQNSTTTSGYALTAAAVTAGVYQNLGIAQSTFSNTCTTVANCNSSLLVDLRLR